MILYIWINSYKNIKKTGFNLSSKYQFDFELGNVKGRKITGKLSCIKKDNLQIFNKQIGDIKAIIGENGSGKSSLLELLISNILTKSNHYNGFIVTDKFVFNRKGIDFGDSITKITAVSLKEVTNLELVNYNRDKFQHKITPEELNDGLHGQIATRHLNYLSIIHYSPLFNIDNVLNIEGVAGSSKYWETDHWHYFNFTTENCIIDDYQSLNIGDTSYYISGESELLAHKSQESKRNLEFLSSEIFNELPFINRISNVKIRLNDFYERFWESIDSFLKADNEIEGRIYQVIRVIRDKDFRKEDKLKELEANLYVSFIYGALMYEYKSMMNFGDRGKSNALLETIEKFLNASTKTKIHKTTLQNFLNSAQFAGKFSNLIFGRIKKAIDFILKSSELKNKGLYDFSIPLSSPDTLKQFIKLFYDDFIFDDDNIQRVFIFHIFSIEYDGLSSGERNLLSMFSRFKRAKDLMPATQSEIIFLLDEAEVTLHPQWQTSFIKLLDDNLPKLFPEKALQIIILSHSPILISDLPKNNILFLEKDINDGNCKVSELRDINNTFGANIHSLYADAFFLKDKGGSMGEFAKGIIKNVINELNEDEPKNSNYLKAVINLVGEPLIQNQLLELFYRKFPEQRIDNIDTRIKLLQRELNSALEIKHRNNEIS